MKTTFISNFKSQLIFLLLCPAGICFFSGCSDPLEELANENTDAIVTKAVVWICSDSYIGTYVDGVLVYGYNGTHCWPELQGGYPEYPWAGGSDPYIPDEPPAYQGGGQGTATYWTSQFAQLQGIYGYNSTLNLSEKDRLHAALYAMNNTEPVQYKELFDELKDRLALIGARITFRMDTTIRVAHYDRTDKSISFVDLDAITDHVVQEELFHAAQDVLFYGATMDGRYKNYDFEARVFNDLVIHMVDPNSSVFRVINTGSHTPDFVEEYTEWIDLLTILRYFPAGEIARFDSICQQWTGGTQHLSGFEPRVLRYFLGHPVPIVDP